MLRALAALIATLVATGVAAQDIPALKDASGEERARLLALIEAAKKEGALTYWDVVIQPETNDALTAALVSGTRHLVANRPHRSRNFPGG